MATKKPRASKARKGARLKDLKAKRNPKAA